MNENHNELREWPRCPISILAKNPRRKVFFNPLVPNAPFFSSEIFTVFLCFQGAEKGCIGKKWVTFYKELIASF